MHSAIMKINTKFYWSKCIEATILKALQPRNPVSEIKRIPLKICYNDRALRLGYNDLFIFFANNFTDPV